MCPRQCFLPCSPFSFVVEAIDLGQADDNFHSFCQIAHNTIQLLLLFGAHSIVLAHPFVQNDPNTK